MVRNYSGVMKHLIKFNEMYDSSIIRDIQDICLELTDDGRIGASVETTSGKFKTYVIFGLSHHEFLSDGFKFEDISEYVFRIKDFLGDNYKSSSVSFSSAVGKHQAFDRINVNLDSKSDLQKLEDNEIRNFVIQLK